MNVKILSTSHEMKENKDQDKMGVCGTKQCNRNFSLNHSFKANINPTVSVGVGVGAPTCGTTQATNQEKETQETQETNIKNNSYVNFTKKKYKEFNFSYSDFNNFEIFYNRLKNEFSTLEYKRYSVLFRVCFGNEAEFKMLGQQTGFFLERPDTEVKDLNNLHTNIHFRLENSMLNYNFSGEEIISVQLIFYEVKYTSNVVKTKGFTLKALGVNKDFVTTTSEKVDLGYNKLIPMSMDISEYPNKL